MSSFELQYDADEDVLEITFSVFDERFVRTLPLNDHILVFADLGLEAAWGLTFYSFSRLLGVSETEFTSLRDLPEAQIESILALLLRPPANHFFDLTDPAGLIARIRTPTLEALALE